MDELALNILDIACNSVTAKANTVIVKVTANTVADKLDISISDDGRGMSKEFLAKVTDPFSTTRTTRRVGMGIPLFKMAAEMAGGNFSIESTVGKGTTTKASFVLSHIDRVPLGDLAGSITTLIGMDGNCDVRLEYAVDGRSYIFDTQEVKSILDGVDIKSNEIIIYLKQMIEENIKNVNGGTVL